MVISNNRKTEESVLIYDQLPITMNEDVKVESIDPQIDNDKLNNDRELKWNVKLKPGEKKIIPLKYQVKFPNDVHVYGLE